MVGAPTLLGALADSIGGGVNNAAAVRRQHDARVRSVTDLLNADDMAGKYWPAGAMDQIRRWVAIDSRCDFVSRLPRSAHFGELLAGEYEAVRFGTRSAPVLECGRLLNVFVTSFDAVCDDIPEALPKTLSQLAPILEVFPESAPESSRLEANLSGLVVGVARSFADRLGGAILRLPEAARESLSSPIRKAYAAQLSELASGIGDPATAEKEVEAKSVGPFAVALMIPHAFHGDLSGIEAIGPVARAMGRLFGWVDDLADWKEDAFRGRPTSLSLFLSTPIVDAKAMEAAMPRLVEETQSRLHDLRTVLHEHNLEALEPSMLGIVLDWFNTPM